MVRDRKLRKEYTDRNEMSALRRTIEYRKRNGTSAAMARTIHVLQDYHYIRKVIQKYVITLVSLIIQLLEQLPVGLLKFLSLFSSPTPFRFRVLSIHSLDGITHERRIPNGCLNSTVSNVRTFPGNSGILKDGRVFFSEQVARRALEGRIRLLSRNFFVLKNGLALYRPHRRVTTVKRGFWLGRYAYDNWFHWNIEICASVVSTLSRSNIMHESLYTPVQIAHMPNFRRTLDLMNETFKTETIWVADDEAHEFQNLVLPRLTVETTPHPVDGFWPTTEDTQFDPESLRIYRDFVINNIKPTLTGSPDKVYINRRSGTNRPTNDSQLVVELASQGFASIDPALLPFDDQVMLFRNASIVVGPTGAAWTGLLFMRPSATAVIALPSQRVDATAWKTLAKISNCRVKFIFGKSQAATYGEIQSTTWDVDVCNYLSALSN